MSFPFICSHSVSDPRPHSPHLTRHLTLLYLLCVCVQVFLVYIMVLCLNVILLFTFPPNIGLLDMPTFALWTSSSLGFKSCALRWHAPTPLTYSHSWRQTLVFLQLLATVYNSTNIGMGSWMTLWSACDWGPGDNSTNIGSLSPWDPHRTASGHSPFFAFLHLSPSFQFSASLAWVIIIIRVSLPPTSPDTKCNTHPQGSGEPAGPPAVAFLSVPPSHVFRASHLL